MKELLQNAWITGILTTIIGIVVAEGIFRIGKWIGQYKPFKKDKK